MKNNKHIKSFNEASENLNISGVSKSFEDDAKKAAEDYANKINKNFFGMKLPEKNRDTIKDFLAGVEWAKKNSNSNFKEGCDEINKLHKEIQKLLSEK